MREKRTRIQTFLTQCPVLDNLHVIAILFIITNFVVCYTKKSYGFVKLPINYLCFFNLKFFLEIDIDTS